MNKAIIALWVIVLLLLFGGWMPFALIAVFFILTSLYYLIFYKRNLHREWRKEQLDYLDACCRFGNREEYERKRQEYISQWHKDPGTYQQRRKSL